MPNVLPLNVLLVYDTHEFGSVVANSMERQGLVLPPTVVEYHTLFTWLAGGMCYKKNEALRTAKALRTLGHSVTTLDIKDLSLTDAGILLHENNPINLEKYDGAWLRLAGRDDKSRFRISPARPEYFDIISYIEGKIPTVTPFQRSIQLDGKVETQYFLEEHQIPAPRSLVILTNERENPDLESKIDSFTGDYPKGSMFVLKKDRGSMGHGAPYKKKPMPWDSLQSEFRGIFLHDDPTLLKEKLFKWLRPGIHKGVLLQEFVRSSGTKERRVEVFVTPSGPKILHACERERTSNVDLPVLSDVDREVAFKVAKAAGSGRWGIDLIGSPPRILELNPFSTMRSRLTKAERLRRSDAFFTQIATGIASVIQHHQSNDANKDYTPGALNLE